MRNKFDVIIVGGGAAGISAARRGEAALILEASSRLGGRAFTQDLGGLCANGRQRVEGVLRAMPFRHAAEVSAASPDQGRTSRAGSGPIAPRSS